MITADDRDHIACVDESAAVIFIADQQLLGENFLSEHAAFPFLGDDPLPNLGQLALVFFVSIIFVS